MKISQKDKHQKTKSETFTYIVVKRVSKIKKKISFDKKQNKYKIETLLLT